MDFPKTYKIKLEDKAAFLNKLEAVGIEFSSFDIQDDLLNNTFSITLKTPKEVEMVKAVLKSSPNINDIKENIKKEISKQIREYLEI
jgi:transcriptional regulator CtsR